MYVTFAMAQVFLKVSVIASASNLIVWVFAVVIIHMMSVEFVVEKVLPQELAIALVMFLTVTVSVAED